MNVHKMNDIHALRKTDRKDGVHFRMITVKL